MEKKPKGHHSQARAETSWEARWAVRQAKDSAEPSEFFQPPPRPDTQSADCTIEPAEDAQPVEKVEVTARHALLGTEVQIWLPQRAKFKHVKRALAKCLGAEEFLTRGQVLHKFDGVYKPYKDSAPLGEVRNVLVMCPGLQRFEADEAAAKLSDAELSEEELAEAVSAEGCQAEQNSGELSRRAAAGHNAAWRNRAPALGSPDIVRAVGSGFGFGVRRRKKAAQLEDVNKPQARARSKAPRLNKQQALALQMELLEGFTAPDFQAELRAFAGRRGEFASHAEFVLARQDLFLTVQSRVLPAHGLEGSRIGVVQMMAALGPLLHDREVMRLGDEIHKLLGVDLSPDNFRALCKQCGDLKTEDLADAREAAKAREARATEAKQSERQKVEDGVSRLSIPSRRSVDKEVPSLPAPVPIPRSWYEDARGQDGGVIGHDIRSFLDALPFPRWSSPIPPLCMSIAGSWNGFLPQPMQWMAGLFMYPVTVGPTGGEKFHLFLDGKRDSSVYPSAPDANHYDDYIICGPNASGAGRSWQIGKGYPDAEDSSCPSMRFAIVAALDAGAAVKLVGWQQF